MYLYTLVFALIGLLVLNRPTAVLSHGRISIDAARQLDTTLSEELEQMTADYLHRASLIAQMSLNKAGEHEADPLTEAPVDDFSKIPFKCPYFPPSSSVPTSVHELRPGDIKVVAAMGDSITAGNGIRASTGLGTWMTPNRGESFSVGGERSLDEGVVTLLNIIRKFNPLVEGGSYCVRRRNERYTGYNVAVPGATNFGLEAQAKDLVTRLAKDLDTFYDKWKVVTLLIGGNDMCQHSMSCSLAARLSNTTITAEDYRNGIEKSLDVLYQHLPRTFVNLQIMTEVGFVKNLSLGGTPSQLSCKQFLDIACPCGLNDTAEEAKKLQMDMYDQLVDLVDSGKYDGREDFTVVIQPFLRDQQPFTTEDGSIDMSFFAPDCFHPGVKMHQAFAQMLWNTMLTRVGEKVFKWDESLGVEYKCPSESSPFLFTKKNS